MADRTSPSNDTWVPFNQRAEWLDFPVPETQAEAPLMSIQCSEQQAQTLSLLNAVVAAGERSSRALQLTEEVIDINPASYTAWEWRWQCLLHQGGDSWLGDEASYLTSIAADNAKNYQLWNYRRRFAFHRGESYAKEELTHAAECLLDDPKNYHVWAHRQAIVEHFNLYEDELRYLDGPIKADVRNNSAWNQRYFVVSRTLDREGVEGELQYAVCHLLRAPHNESPWSYLRGLLKLLGMPGALASNTSLHKFCCEVLEANPSCSPALEMLADFYDAQAQCSQGDLPAASHARAQASSNASACLAALLTADPMRSKYWLHRLHALQGTTGSDISL